MDASFHLTAFASHRRGQRPAPSANSRFAWILAAMTACGALSAGCGGGGEEQAGGAPAAVDFVDEEATAEERPYIEAARPFVVAMAEQRYDDAYAMLSSHARARMTLNQFCGGLDEAEAHRNQQNPVLNVDAARFKELFGTVTALFGTPAQPEMLYVESLDPAVLSGGGEALEAAFAIGAMPADIPFDIRRAALRGRIGTRHTPERLAQIAEQEGLTIEQLDDVGFSPYFNFKLVLVDEGGQLKVGYFEFMPPSIWD